MKGFGIGLRAVRAGLRVTQRDIARAALGEDTEERKIIDFANYMSRVERETRDARNPSLLLLEQYAQGFGMTLSALFLEIEGVIAGLQNRAARSHNWPLKPTSPRETMKAPVNPEGASYGSDSVSDPQEIAAILSSLQAELRLQRVHIARLTTRLEGTRGHAPHAQEKPSTSR